MKRTKRTLKDSFPECSVPRAELERIFAEMREQRLAAGRHKTAGSRNPARKNAVSVVWTAEMRRSGEMR